MHFYNSHEVEIINYLNSNARELGIVNDYKIIKQIFIKYNCSYNLVVKPILLSAPV